MQKNVKGEEHTGRVAAVFSDEAAANAAKQKLLDRCSLNEDRITIVYPHDEAISKKIEPDSAGILHTILKSHFWLGIGGVIIGIIIASILITIGPDLTQSSPMFTYFVFIFFGAVFGLMLAGGISLRPGHDPLINKTVTASDSNNWVLIVQTDTQEEIERVKDLLKGDALSMSESL